MLGSMLRRKKWFEDTYATLSVIFGSLASDSNRFWVTLIFHCSMPNARKRLGPRLCMCVYFELLEAALTTPQKSNQIIKA